MKEHRRRLREVAQELDVDPRIVEHVITHYLGMIRRIMGSGNPFVINIRTFGTFRYKKQVLKLIKYGEDVFAEYNKHEEKFDRKPFVRITREDVIDNKYYGRVK